MRQIPEVVNRLLSDGKVFYIIASYLNHKKAGKTWHMISLNFPKFCCCLQILNMRLQAVVRLSKDKNL